MAQPTHVHIIGVISDSYVLVANGEGWFRTKNPAGGVTVATPTASATLRGTEINIAIRGARTVLTVAEGAAELSSPFGSIVVNAGEEATATPGQPPTKRVVLNLDDAVQWSLYLTQRFPHSVIANLPESSVPLTDASFGYEFARKRGFLSLSATNLFDRQFQVVIENLTVEQPRPQRRLLASLRWRL